MLFILLYCLVALFSEGLALPNLRVESFNGKSGLVGGMCGASRSDLPFTTASTSLSGQLC